LDGIPTVGFHAVASLFGNQGRCDHPAAMSLFRQITIEPVPTGARFIDKDEVCGFGVQLAHELINVALPSADRAKINDLSRVLLGDIGHGNGFFMHIQSDVQCARVTHG
jgi:hypothetical protein